MTSDRAKAIRIDAGLSLAEMAHLINLKDPYGNGARRVREYEAGQREISGPVARILQLLAAGYLGDPYTVMELQ